MPENVRWTHSTWGCCAKFIDIELDAERVKQVRFIGGCAGNAQGIAALVKGLPVAEVTSRLRGIICRNGTSCPDQLAQALEGQEIRAAG